MCESIICDFGHRRLVMQGDRRGLELPVVESTTHENAKIQPQRDEALKLDKRQADKGRRLMIEDVERVGRDNAAAMVRPAPKRTRTLEYGRNWYRQRRFLMNHRTAKAQN